MKRRWLGGTTMVTLVISLLAVPGSSAQTTPGGEQVLQISPVRQEATLQPGETSQQEVTIRNLASGPVRLSAAFKNYLAEGEEGGTRIVDEPTPYDLARWATVSESDFTLNGREARTVKATFRVPTDASPGGYYGLLRFMVTDRSNIPNVSIQGSVATLYLVRVAGTAREAGHFESIDITRQDGVKTGWFFFGDRLNLQARLRNSGNVHFAAEPQFTASNQFGNTALDVRANSANIFPGAVRRFDVLWNNVGTGYYTVHTTNQFPDGSETKSLKVLVVTPRAAVAALGILLVVVILFATTVRRRRKPRAGW